LRILSFFPWPYVCLLSFKDLPVGVRCLVNRPPASSRPSISAKESQTFFLSTFSSRSYVPAAPIRVEDPMRVSLVCLDTSFALVLSSHSLSPAFRHRQSFSVSHISLVSICFQKPPLIRLGYTHPESGVHARNPLSGLLFIFLLSLTAFSETPTLAPDDLFYISRHQSDAALRFY